MVICIGLFFIVLRRNYYKMQLLYEQFLFLSSDLNHCESLDFCQCEDVKKAVHEVMRRLTQNASVVGIILKSNNSLK